MKPLKLLKRRMPSLSIDPTVKLHSVEEGRGGKGAQVLRWLTAQADSGSSLKLLVEELSFSCSCSL